MKKIIPLLILIAVLGLLAFIGVGIVGVNLDSIFNRPFKDKYSNAGLNYSFAQLDPKIKPILDNYAKTYHYAVDSGKWPYKKDYNLEDFILLLLIYNDKNGNIEGVYAAVPAAMKLDDNFEEVPNMAEATTSLRFVHVSDKALIKKLFKTRHDNSSFGVFNSDAKKYLYFILDKDFFANELSKFSINQEIGFFTHEGFHLIPQAKFKRPNEKYGSLRFNLPPDYPVDETSFSLIAAGMKLYEDVLFKDDLDLEQYARMYYVLFKKLLEQDHSNKGYIDGFYFFEMWLEGSAEFVESDLNLGSGVFDKNDPIIQYVNSYKKLVDQIDREIDNGPAKSNINGVEKSIKYTELIDDSYYHLGSASLFVLDALGVDVISQLKSGMNQYQMLSKYIQDNQIAIDEEQTYSDLRSQINWSESLARMKKYIKLFE